MIFIEWLFLYLTAHVISMNNQIPDSYLSWFPKMWYYFKINFANFAKIRSKNKYRDTRNPDTNTNTYHSTSLSIFMQIWGQISDSVVCLSLWTISKKKKKKSKKQLLSSKGEQQKETKGIWLRRNLINDSDNGYERSTRRSMRNDPISIAITQANYPFHRSDGRLPCKKN